MSDDVLSLISGEKPSKYSVQDVQNMVYGQESNFGKTNTSSPNYAGAVGPMQILPSTFEGLKNKGLIPKNYDINNPVHNKEAGNALIADAYNRYNGDADKVLAEYYGGPKAVEGNKIHTEFRDLKNPNAPTVGQYINQAKTKIEPFDDVSNLILGNKPTEKITQKTIVKQPETNAFVGYPHLMRQAQNAQPSIAKQQLEQAGKDLTNPSFIAKDVASLFDNTVGGVLPFFVKNASYLGTRFLGDEKATEISNKLSSYVDKPIGKAFGITNDPVYQNEALSKIMSFIGENKEKGDAFIARQLGIPPSDVSFFTNLAMLKAKPLKTAEQAANVIENVTGSLNEAVTEMKKSKNVPISTTPQKSTLVGVGAAKSEINPYKGFTGEDTIAKGEYPTVKLSRIAKDVPINEQSKIASIVKEIMGDNASVRPGVLTRNENVLRNEFAEAKMPNPTVKGQLLKEQIANEQNALYQYAADRIDKTGANKNLINDSERGQLLHDAMASEEGLLGYLKSAKENIYREAEKIHGKNPIQTTS